MFRFMGIIHRFIPNSFYLRKKNNRNLHCFLADGLEFYSPKLSFDIVHSWKYLCKMFKRKKKKKDGNFQECFSYRSNLHKKYIYI